MSSVMSPPWQSTRASHWETTSEVDLLGFNLYRSDSGEPGSFDQLNQGLIPAQAAGSPSGARYEWIDTDVVPGSVFFYLLEDLDINGQTTEYGPIQGCLLSPTLYLPLLLKGH